MISSASQDTQNHNPLIDAMSLLFGGKPRHANSRSGSRNSDEGLNV
jgi:hypothetical protein